MERPSSNGATYGPWLVGLGAALWGTESAWRIPLNALFDAKVIVFWEHVLILIMFVPLLVSRLAEIRKIDARTWGYLIFSGFAGSAVGTVFFTLALKYGNPTVVNVILNIQPVISTMAAFLIFGDRLATRFFLYASIAILAGIFVSVAHPALIGVSFERAGLSDVRLTFAAPLRHTNVPCMHGAFVRQHHSVCRVGSRRRAGITSS